VEVVRAIQALMVTTLLPAIILFFHQLLQRVEVMVRVDPAMMRGGQVDQAVAHDTVVERAVE
jgi:heme exporter protein D